jgi:hypothetical protein
MPFTSLTVQLRRSVNPNYTNDAAGNAGAAAGGNPQITDNQDFLFGSGTGQVNDFGARDFTLTGNTPQSIDFSGGAELKNPLGENTAYTRLNYIRIQNDSTSASDFTLSGNLLAAIGLVAGFTLEAGDAVEIQRPVTVTNSSQDTLTITPTAGGRLRVIVAGVR